MKKIFLILGLGALILSSCNEINTFTLGDNQGAFILNKGNSETSTLSRYDYEQEKVTNTIFQKKNNGLKLGAGASAFTIKRSEDYLKGRGYMVFTERGEVDMINMDNYRIEATIDGLSYPNDIVLANESSAYVSCGNGLSNTDKDNVVVKINLDNHSVVKTIQTGVGPGKLMTSGKYLYVANSGGQNQDGNTITVIDMSNDVVVETVTVGTQPIDMEVDLDRNIWVYCDGDASGNNQSLYRIHRNLLEESITHTPEMVVDLGSKQGNGQNALAVTKDGRFLFYVHGKAYFRSIYKDDDSADDEAIVGDYSDVTLVGLDTDARTGYLHGLYQEGNNPGKFLVFTVQSSRYVLSEEHEVGINPIFTTYNY